MHPLRSCIACRKREVVLLKKLNMNSKKNFKGSNSSTLLHLVVRDNQVTPDPLHNLLGRGAWIHPQCFELAKQRGSFSRAFRSKIGLNTEALKKYLEHIND